MESEVAGLIGAERHERTGDRTEYRNGSRTRTWDTRGGTIELAHSEGAAGDLLPVAAAAASARRARVARGHPGGVRARHCDADLVKALGLDGISKSEVSRIVGELDPIIAAFRTRPLTGEHRYLWLDCDVP